MAAAPSDDSYFPSAMNLQDLLDMSNAVPEECAASLPTAQGTTKADKEQARLHTTISYEDQIQSKISSLLDSSALSDVTFAVGDGEDKTEIKAHKLVLALSSPVFQAMFYGELTSSDPANAKNSSLIEIPDCAPHAFKALLQFIYKGVQPTLTVDDALSLLYASRKYAVRGLEDMCCVVLSSSITADNVFDILYAATFYNLTALDYQCWEFMEENAVQVLSAHLDYLTHETIRSLLKNDRLNASEAELFQVLIKWAELECSKQNLDPTPENVRGICGEELKMIRFPTMSGQEFADVVVPTNILAVDQVCKIFTLINASEEKKVSIDTEFCGTKRTPKTPTARPGTPRPPVFTFIAKQIREDNQTYSVLVPTDETDTTTESIPIVVPIPSITSNSQGGGRRQRQSRRSRRRNNAANQHNNR